MCVLLRGFARWRCREGEFEAGSSPLEVDGVLEAVVERGIEALAGITWLEGDRERALAQYDKALAIYRYAGYRRGEASCLANKGTLLRGAGKLDRAEERTRVATSC